MYFPFTRGSTQRDEQNHVDHSRYFPTPPIAVDTASLTTGYQRQSGNSLSLVTLPMGDKGPELPRRPAYGFLPSRIYWHLAGSDSTVTADCASAHTLALLVSTLLPLSSSLLFSPLLSMLDNNRHCALSILRS